MSLFYNWAAWSARETKSILSVEITIVFECVFMRNKLRRMIHDTVWFFVRKLFVFKFYFNIIIMSIWVVVYFLVIEGFIIKIYSIIVALITINSWPILRWTLWGFSIIFVQDLLFISYFIFILTLILLYKSI